MFDDVEHQHAIEPVALKRQVERRRLVHAGTPVITLQGDLAG